MTGSSERHRQLIESLNLQPHPEGGHFGEIYRADGTVSDVGSGEERRAATGIYFLLNYPEFSHWHTVRWDENWHYYEGGPLELLTIDPESLVLERRVLHLSGDDSRPVLTVPGGHWQAARPLTGFTLAGCTVAPGFEFADFALLRDGESIREIIADRFPDVAGLL